LGLVTKVKKRMDTMVRLLGLLVAVLFRFCTLSSIYPTTDRLGESLTA